MHSPLGLLSTTGRYPISYYNDTLKRIYFWVFVTHTLIVRNLDQALHFTSILGRKDCAMGEDKNPVKMQLFDQNASYNCSVFLQDALPT